VRDDSQLRTALTPFVTNQPKFRDLIRTRDQRKAYCLIAYSLRRLLHWLPAYRFQAYSSPEMLPLIGILLVVLGFAARLNPLLVVTVAGLATGVASGLGPVDVVSAFGRADSSRSSGSCCR